MTIRRGRRGPMYAGELLQSPLYSGTCKDAFRIMERLAAAAVRRPGSLRNENVLAGETGLSLPALEQVVHFLRLAGLVETSGGRAAGIRLARPASRVSLLEVVRAIDGTGLWARCILGLEECSDAMPWHTRREVLIPWGTDEDGERDPRREPAGPGEGKEPFRFLGRRARVRRLRFGMGTG